MSSLIVQVKQIDKVRPHSNADKLEICDVEGWQCVTQKGLHKEGNKILYVPPDSIIPEAQAKLWGVFDYLGTGGRVKVVKLRGENSFGCIIPLDKDYPIGTDLAEHFGITKYIPRTSMSGGSNKASNARPKHPLWQKYTEVEHLRNYKNVIEEGEEVICTEKIHGSNVSICLLNGELVVGSRNMNRKEPGVTVKKNLSWWAKLTQWRWKTPFDLVFEERPELRATDTFWYPATHSGVLNLLRYLHKEYQHQQIQIFGEVFGPIQGLHYGSPDKLQFRAFDILIDGKYLPYDTFIDYCMVYDIPTCPPLYRGPYSFQKVKEAANGKTLVGEDTNQMREGCVVKPVLERNDPRLGRIIFKFISDEYYLAQYGKNPPADILEE